VTAGPRGDDPLAASREVDLAAASHLLGPGADDVLPVKSVPFVSSDLLAEAGQAEADAAIVAGYRNGLVDAGARAGASRQCRL
jgi:hypothetical protein